MTGPVGEDRAQPFVGNGSEPNGANLRSQGSATHPLRSLDLGLRAHSTRVTHSDLSVAGATSLVIVESVAIQRNTEPG